MNLLGLIIDLTFILIVIKILIVGSDFSLYYWMKYKGKYWRWHSRRETFEEHLEDIE